MKYSDLALMIHVHMKIFIVEISMTIPVYNYTYSLGSVLKITIHYILQVQSYCRYFKKKIYIYIYRTKKICIYLMIIIL